MILSTACAGEQRPAATDTPAATSTPDPTVTETPAPRPSPSPSAPAFRGTVSPLNATVRERMTGSTWEPGCPVGLGDLRHLRLSHWGTDDASHDGEMIVHADEADAVVAIFRRIFDARYPITKMRLMDAYDGDDDASMLDNNTSGFNCRKVKGLSSWSQHSYGRAIDVNPFKNPWVDGDTVDPPQAAKYADRSIADPQLIRRGDAVWKAFAASGWSWGGDWQSSKDYQHFSARGR